MLSVRSRAELEHEDWLREVAKLSGKVERSRRVDDQEFYQLLDKDVTADEIHLFDEELREWRDYYNFHRPHGGLDGQTPNKRLLAKEDAAGLSARC